MAILTREQMLAPAPVPVEEVAAPGFGGSVFVRILTAAQRDRYEVALSEDRKQGRGHNYRARVLAVCVCDEAGKSIFSDADIPALAALPSTHVDPIVEAFMRLHGMGVAAQEVIEKKSEDAAEPD